jgi:hypothetical protein
VSAGNGGPSALPALYPHHEPLEPADPVPVTVVADALGALFIHYSELHYLLARSLCGEGVERGEFGMVLMRLMGAVREAHRRLQA